MGVKIKPRKPGRDYEYAEVWIDLPKRLRGYEMGSTYGGCVVAEVRRGKLGVILRKRKS